MCLFPMGGGGFNMRPVCPPTPEALKHKQNLKYVLIAHAVMTVSYMVISTSFSLQDIILCLILYCAMAQMHFCHLIIYMMMCLYSWMGYITFLGLKI